MFIWHALSWHHRLDGALREEGVLCEVLIARHVRPQRPLLFHFSPAELDCIGQAQGRPEDGRCRAHEGYCCQTPTEGLPEREVLPQEGRSPPRNAILGYSLRFWLAKAPSILRLDWTPFTALLLLRSSQRLHSDSENRPNTPLSEPDPSTLNLQHRLNQQNKPFSTPLEFNRWTVQLTCNTKAHGLAPST